MLHSSSIESRVGGFPVCIFVQCFWFARSNRRDIYASSALALSFKYSMLQLHAHTKKNALSVKHFTSPTNFMTYLSAIFFIPASISSSIPFPTPTACRIFDQ